MLTIPNIKEATNESLARTALNCLKELEHRGNKEIEKARQDVFLFHEGILALKSMAIAIERSLEADYEDDYDEHHE